MRCIGLRSRGTTALMLATSALLGAAGAASGQADIQVSFLWHMHQPIYYPYESVVQTQAANRYSFSVIDVHNQRFGPYTTWPRDALQMGLAQPHLGAQVSFTGSLIENLNTLNAAGVNGGMWSNWDSGYDQARQWLTSLGNPRLDIVAFGYHHPLMPLLDRRDVQMQIRLYKHIYGQTFAGSTAFSRGMFPAETAFSTRMIPALAAEGIEWVMVDNIHFDRACEGYPYTPASNLIPPNRADQINPDPAATGGAWVQLNNLWAPSKVSAPFGYQPHRVQHVDPETGAITRIVAVPAARYEGNEDGRGGYGAFLYQQVMDQYLAYNTNPDRPMLVLLHHDGDNYGGGSEAYYHGNFQAFANWIAAAPNYQATTVQDYLDRFPVPEADVIHVESGSWAGADNGDAEFKKWLGDPVNGWSPDRNSWAVLTAAKNRVFTADDILPATNMQNILTDAGTQTERAWHDLLCSQASDYWYWDGTEIWDSNVTRGCNLAVAHADAVIAGGADTTPPTVFLPQREPYNPGAIEWGSSPMPVDFEVWTYAYDVSGLSSVTLKWRADADGVNPIGSIQNETFAGGPEVGTWNSVPMTMSDTAPPAGILSPTYRAKRYGAMVTGQASTLIDYYVEAVDSTGRITRSDIQHVWVGDGTGGSGGGGGGGGGSSIEVAPEPVEAGEPLFVAFDPAGGPLSDASSVFIHWGINGWNPVMGPDAPMAWDALLEEWTITLNVPSTAHALDMVFNNGAGTWDNNGGADWHFPVVGGSGPVWSMDGVLDPGAIEVASNGGMRLHADLSGDFLYIATNDAGEGNDHFIYLAGPQGPGAMQSANWAKSGQVAAWDAYLADENNNDYEGWFDAAGTRQAATGPNGGVIEGTLNLREEFGEVPDRLWLAVGVFATADGGALVNTAQTPPAIIINGSIEPQEWVMLDLQSLFGTPGLVGDLNGDCAVDFADLNLILGAWGAAGAAADPADANGDGEVNFADLNLVLGAWGAEC